MKEKMRVPPGDRTNLAREQLDPMDPIASRGGVHTRYFKETYSHM